MKKQKGPAALVWIALAADMGYVLLKGAKTILKREKASVNSSDKKGK